MCAKVPSWEPKCALKCPSFRPCPSKSLRTPLLCLHLHVSRVFAWGREKKNRKRHAVSVRCFQLQPVKWNVNEVLQRRGFTFFCFWIFMIEFINWYRGWCRNSGHIPNIGWHILITGQNDIPFLRQQNQNIHFVLFFFAKLFKLSCVRHKLPPRKIYQTVIWRLG